MRAPCARVALCRRCFWLLFVRTLPFRWYRCWGWCCAALRRTISFVSYSHRPTDPVPLPVHRLLFAFGRRFRARSKRPRVPHRCRPALARGLPPLPQSCRHARGCVPAVCTASVCCLLPFARPPRNQSTIRFLIRIRPHSLSHLLAFTHHRTRSGGLQPIRSRFGMHSLSKALRFAIHSSSALCALLRSAL